MLQGAIAWTIVHAAVAGFMLLPIAMVGILSLLLARHRRDPARRAFSWLKGCHPFLLASISCITSADILNVILYSWQNDDGYYDTVNHTHDEISAMIRSERYLSFTGNLFEQFVDIFFVLILVELGNGLMHSLDGRSSPYQLRLRYAAYAIVIFLLSMALAYFGQPASAWVAYWNGSESNASYAQLIQSLRVVGKIGASFYIPSWMVSIGQIVYASFVVHKHRKPGVMTRHIAILYLTIAVLDFVRWTFFVVLYAQWILPSSDNPWWWNLVDGLGNTWLRFVQMALLLLIGMRRRKGMWTTEQPWMASDASMLASEMDSTHDAGPSPVMSPGTSYAQAAWPQKEYSRPPPTEQALLTPPRSSPGWPQTELATPQPAVSAPQELDSMQYQYVPHPLLGPGYLVLQSQFQIQQLQQLEQQQQQPQPQESQTLQPHLHHQHSFQSQHHHTQ